MVEQFVTNPGESDIDAMKRRIMELEAGRAVSLNDLPLAALQAKLENDWQPDAAALLLPSSVGRDAMVQKINFGVDTVTFAASQFSANKTIAHGIGAVPIVAFAIDQTAGSGLYYRTNAYTATTFDVAGYSPFGLLTATPAFGWFVIR